MCATWTFLICFLFLWFAEVFWILTDSKKKRRAALHKHIVLDIIVLSTLEAF